MVPEITPEQMWANFVAKLNEVQPLGKNGNEKLKHQNLFGSIASYRKIFLDANKPAANSDSNE